MIITKRNLLIGLLCTLLTYLGGCASIVKGTTQDIPMTSVPPGADVLVDGALVGQTPLKAQLKRKSDHLVTIQKSGYQPKTVAVVKDVGGAVWGNILLGGLIGWGVDASTGAQYNLTPKTINIELERAGSATTSTGPDEATQFVKKLNALDQMKESKQISGDEYGKARLELFRKYMPEALPEDARSSSPTESSATSDSPVTQTENSATSDSPVAPTESAPKSESASGEAKSGEQMPPPT